MDVTAERLDMKRFLFIFAALCMCIPLCAQTSSDQYGTMTVEDFENMSTREFTKYKFSKMWTDFPKFEVRIGVAGYPIADDFRFNSGEHRVMWDATWSDVFDLDEIYAPQPGPTYMTGNFLAEFSWHAKTWFTLAGCIYANGIYGSVFDPYTGERISRNRGISLAILPVARFYWRNFERCRFYTSLGLGVSYASYKGDTSVIPTFQFAPIGITAGRKVFFFAEYNYGITTFGGQAGLGYRF